MKRDIKTVSDINGLIEYFVSTLGWKIDLDYFEDIEDITYDFDAEDIGLKEDAFAKIKNLRQLRPLVDGQRWGIFCVEFDSRKFEITALRKILSGLIPTRRNSAEHAVWDQQDLLFMCFWGEGDNRTIGIAHFEDKETGLPQIKMIYCAPAVEDFTQTRVFEDRLKKLKWPEEFVDHEKWQVEWSSAFKTAYRQTINDATTLTAQLAIEAQGIRDRILSILGVETRNGYVHLLYDKFKDTLIHDMTETQFADMYAQTVVYGLFSARCMDDTQEDFSAAEAVECIPNTNPFLKSLMKECLGTQNSKLSFDELEIGNVVDLLLHTKTDAIIQDFNRQTGGGREDPVIHFYEEFLEAYDKNQKVQRGVYYTPQPVVNFIVRAVDSIIKSEFGFEDGLASTETKKLVYYRESKRKKDGYYTQVKDIKDVPAIQILDPAVGTGTFIRQIILQIYDNFRNKNADLNEEELKKAWNGYVPKHLLPRLNAFELMMAPYAVAHMKLAMVLKDTGYDFGSDERLNVYLTNTLEEPGNSNMQITMFDDPLASESIAANIVKKNNGINVIVGNPPYSAASSNKGKWIQQLMEVYKREPGGKDKLQEKNPKWINDDYVKFIRFSEELLEKSANGIIALINPHGFINNPTFRGMRWHLLKTFDKLLILDLHGNSNRKEKSPDGSKDENVFDIQQGVCILVLIKHIDGQKNDAGVYHADLWGTRQSKYDLLSNKGIEDVCFKKVEVVAPEYVFMPLDLDLRAQYNKGFAVDELFDAYSVGVVTAKDKVLIGESPSSVLGKVQKYYQITPDESLVRPIYYRPLDKQFIYYDQKLLERGREKVMSNFFYENIGLITARSNKGEDCSQFLISDVMSEAKSGERTTQSAIFPLYKYENHFGEMKKICNMNQNMLQKFQEMTGITISNDDETKETTTPEDLMAYIYGVLYYREYRERYKSFINAGFPKIPYPKSEEAFHKFVYYGERLIALHLMNDVEANEADAYLVGETMEKVSYKDSKAYINKTAYIDVDEAEWLFTMGGYQPLQKWLKDRRGKILNKEDVERFIAMRDHIAKTIRIMDEMEEDDTIKIFD